MLQRVEKARLWLDGGGDRAAGSLGSGPYTGRIRHTRDEVVGRTIAEFARLDALLAELGADAFAWPVPRPETKDPWTVQDALAHITHWKADVARQARGLRRPPDERGLGTQAANHLVYLRWKDRPPEEVLAWHRQVQAEVLAALREAPDAWFGDRDRRADWPADLDGHAAWHRARDIERAVTAERARR